MQTIQAISQFQSPLGSILLSADETGLTGLYFADEVQTARWSGEQAERETPVLTDAKRWLDCYFSGKEPDFTPPLHTVGTAFQNEVWALLRAIPYGETTTYGAIARQLAARRSIRRMSAQAVGGAVGRNPVAVIVPCHRVIGSDGSLTGYAGRIDRKRNLLELEGIYLTQQF